MLVEWPSGLRRQVKALISSEARVRIPSQPTKIFYNTYHSINNSAHLAQKVERWPFKPMVVGSIPTVGGDCLLFFPRVYACVCAHKIICILWDSNPRIRRYCDLNAAP